MSVKWYYSRNEEQFGPISDAEIRQLAATGKLQSTDLVWNADLTDWILAMDEPILAAFFPPTIPRSTPPAAPAQSPPANPPQVIIHQHIAQNANPNISQSQHPGTVVVSHGSNTFAAFCSFFIPGLGQLIQGRLVAAIFYFVASIFLWAVALGWIMHIISCIDAARYNPVQPVQLQNGQAARPATSPIAIGCLVVFLIVFLIAAIRTANEDGTSTNSENKSSQADRVRTDN